MLPSPPPSSSLDPTTHRSFSGDHILSSAARMLRFRIEDFLAPLIEIHGRMNELLLQEISSSYHVNKSAHSCRPRLRPFIVHRNQWQRLVHAFSRVLRHISDVLSRILRAPLEALFSAMASAERSLSECVAPHIHESVVFGTSSSSSSSSPPKADESQSSSGIADDLRHKDDGVDCASAEDDEDQSDMWETIDPTEEQLSALQLWMAQKALKHALNSEVQYLHMDNLLTSSIAVHEALSNYCASSAATDNPFDRELAAEILHAEAAEKEEASTSYSRWWSTAEMMKQLHNCYTDDLRPSVEAEYEDMTSAERFFGVQLRQRIGDSSPSTIALAQFVLQRLRNDWDPKASSASAPPATFEHLWVDSEQFSAVMANGEKVIVGRGAASTVLLKTWMMDSHIVAVKELEKAAADLQEFGAAAVDDVFDEGEQLQEESRSGTELCYDCREIATQARVRHPNLLPLLCCTQELKKYDDHVAQPSIIRHLGDSEHPDGAAAAAQPDSYPVYYNTRKVLGLAMERMLFDLEKLIDVRNGIFMRDYKRRRRRSSAAAASIPSPPAPPPFPLHVAVDIMLQIAKGMDYLHRHHIMHRDLKPANILISPDSVNVLPVTHLEDESQPLVVRVKVADFGIAKFGFFTDMSSMKHSANVGTGIWRAPEVMRDDDDDVDEALALNRSSPFLDDDTAKYSTKADVYSFAMVCYHILTGKIPFHGDRSRALRFKIRKKHLRPEFDMAETHTSPSMSCPMALVDMVRCCWHHDTSLRPNFTQIANFLRYMKICAVQLMGTVVGDIDDETHRMQQLLGKPLFSIFRSKDICHRLSEMRMESRRMLRKLETGSSSTAAPADSDDWQLDGRRSSDSQIHIHLLQNTSGTDSITARTATVPHITDHNYSKSAGSSSWSAKTSDSKRRGGAAGFIAKIFARRPTMSPAYASVPDVVRAFTFAKMVKITSNFSMRIGEGGFGCVYKGTLTNGTHVAVKVLYKSEKETFYHEVGLLSRAHHRNLVCLIGYCSQRQPMLVYEFVANGSLNHILHGHSWRGNLSWRGRLKIIKNIAQGINYLHNGCTPTIIHRDLKSSNILINEDMEAKISDFGTSRSISNHDDAGIYTAIAGTIGYLDPQYVINGKLTEKVDIYAFGILMLEIISGRPPIRFIEDNHCKIDNWVKKDLKRNDLSYIVDSRILTSNDESSIRNVLNIAVMCINENVSYRPSIEKLVYEIN